MSANSADRVASRREYQRNYYHKNKHRILPRRRVATSADPEKIRRTNYQHQGLPAPTRPRPEACELCGGKERRALALDHCHETKMFRGWLCAKCNTGLGKLGDNIAGIRRALEYLERFESVSWIER